MPRFLVTEVTKKETTYVIEANSAPIAVNRAKKSIYDSSSSQSINQYFLAKEIEEDVNNDK